MSEGDSRWDADTQRFLENQRSQQSQEQPAEKDNDPVYTKLWKDALKTEGDIVFHGNTTAAALDTYLRAEIACCERRIEYPNISEEYREVQTRRRTEELERYRTLLNGSYYKEKAAFCQQQADDLIQLAGERADDYGRAGRRQAAGWLRTKASCLEMPEGQLPTQAQPKQTE